jgi:hypothetical protein
MSITEILDAVAPEDYTHALALMHGAAACDEMSAIILNDLPGLVTTLAREDLSAA